jgi:HSP20 family protein
MAEKTAEAAAKTENKEARVPELFRERGTFDSLLWDFDRSLDAMRNRFWQSALGRTVSDRFETSWAPSPAVDIAENDKHYEIKAELPGLEPANVEVKVANGLLTIKGEKKEEKEEKKENYYLSERRFGSFQRSFSVPAGVDADKIEASFKNGVLAITLPKTSETIEREKKIAIKAG